MFDIAINWTPIVLSLRLATVTTLVLLLLGTPLVCDLIRKGEFTELKEVMEKSEFDRLIVLYNQAIRGGGNKSDSSKVFGLCSTSLIFSIHLILFRRGEKCEARAGMGFQDPW